jgi:hypothetical protein
VGHDNEANETNQSKVKSALIQSFAVTHEKSPLKIHDDSHYEDLAAKEVYFLLPPGMKGVNTEFNNGMTTPQRIYCFADLPLPLITDTLLCILIVFIRQEKQG